MADTDMIEWTLPDGRECKTNSKPHSINVAEAAGWTRKKAKPKARAKPKAKAED